MFIVSWDEPGAIFGSTEKSKKFSDEDEAYEFYEKKKKEASGWSLKALNPLGSVVKNVRIRRV